MAHVVKLRVKDTTASTGTGTKVLARSTLLNFRTFDAVMANGDTCDAIVVNRSANQWEHSSWIIAGVGGEPVLTRAEFKESSTGAPVHFTEGTKDVLMLYPVAGKLDFTARTIRLVTNSVDGVAGTASSLRLYESGTWIAGIGISSGSLDFRSGWNFNFFSGQSTDLRPIVRINHNGVGIGTALATSVEPNAALHVVNSSGAPSAIITTSSNTAVRIGSNGASSAIEGVDYTGLNAWRPLFLNGDVVILGAQGYEAMRVTANRNVLIGATVESAKLTIGLDGVADPNNYGKAIQITRGPAGGQQMAFIRNGQQVVSLGYLPNTSAFGFGLGSTVDANFWPNYLSIHSGNIGMGTAYPNARLSFGTTAGLAGIYLYDDGNAGATGFGISPNTLNIFANAHSTTSAAIAFGKYDKTTFTEWARIVDGRVGIGMASPGSKLDVMGTTIGVTENIVRIGNYGGSRYMRLGVCADGVNQYPFIQGYHSDLDANAWKLILNPFGSQVGIGGAPSDGILMDVIGSPTYSHFRVINYGTSGAQARIHLTVGGRTITKLVDYDSQYLYEVGYGITTRYSDFDTHNWRSNSGTVRMTLNSDGLGIGRSPGLPLDVMWPSPVTAGYQVVANLGVYNAAGGGAFTRMYIGQLATNVMFLEVANKDNVKGDMVLQPYGGYVIMGARLFSGGDIGQFSMQGDYDGPLTMAMYNHNSVGAGACCKFNMIIGGRRVERLVYHNDRWIQEKGFGIDQYYNEFDTHYWRNNAGLNKMILHSNNVIWLGNTGGDPVTPSGGGYLYTVGGALKYKGSSGTVTTLGAA